jgi:hypothetical protein
MLNLLLALTSSLYFPCLDCLEDQAILVKSQDINLQLKWNQPLTAFIPVQLESPCKPQGVTWKHIDRFEYISDTGISLISGGINSSTRFWNSQNALEAEELLKSSKTGEEIDITQFFKRYKNPWFYSEIPPECFSTEKCPLSPPYTIHYLQSPEKEWVIDLLMIHAKEQNSLNYSRRLSNEMSSTPYMPIFEGRFKNNRTTFWFSATEATPNRVGLWFSTKELEAKQSTPESRYKIFQVINDFLVCTQSNNK